MDSNSEMSTEESNCQVVTNEFESQCSKIGHKKCPRCHSVAINLTLWSDGCCNFCRHIKTFEPAIHLPTWRNETGQCMFHVPSELSDLRDGEKLLIQKLSVYVPLEHLKAGQLGIRGHVCAIPSPIEDVCLQLPRMPDNVRLIKVIKHYKSNDTREVSSISFLVRRKKVVAALR